MRKFLPLLLIAAIFGLTMLSTQLSGQNRYSEPVWQSDMLKIYNPETEVLELRSAGTKHFRIDEYNSVAVTGMQGYAFHYADKDGKLQTIDTRITENQSRDYSEFDYANTTNNFKTFYSSDITRGSMVELVGGATIKDGLNKRMLWLDNNFAVLATNEVNSNSKNILKSENMSYSNVFNGIDLVYTQNNMGVKMDYVINSKSAIGNVPAKAKYLAFAENVEYSDGLTMVIEDLETREGEKVNQINFVDAAGNVLMSYIVPKHIDANNNNIKYKYHVDNNTVYTLVPVEWLMSEERAYPITIDPTKEAYLMAGNTNTGKFSGTAYNGGCYSDGEIGIGIYNNAQGWRAFLGFESPDAVDVPACGTITSVTMYLRYFGYVYGSAAPASGSTFVVRKLLSTMCNQMYNSFSADNYVAASPYNYTAGNYFYTFTSWGVNDVNTNRASNVLCLVAPSTWATAGTSTAIYYDGILRSPYPPYLIYDYNTNNCCEYPKVSITNTTDVMCGDTFTLTGSATNIPNGTTWEYQWSLNGTPISSWSSSPDFTLSNLASGTYTLTARNVNSPNCIVTVSHVFTLGVDHFAQAHQDLAIGSSLVNVIVDNNGAYVDQTPATCTQLVNNGFEALLNPGWSFGANPASSYTQRSTDHPRTGNYSARLGWWTTYPFTGDYATVYATVNLTNVEQIVYYTAIGKTNATPNLRWYSECWVGGSANTGRNGTQIGNFQLDQNFAGGASVWTQRTVTVPPQNRTTNQVLKFVCYISTGSPSALGSELFYNFIDDISFICVSSAPPTTGTITSTTVNLDNFCDENCLELVTDQTLNGGSITYEILDANNNIVGGPYTATVSGEDTFNLPDTLTGNIKIKATLNVGPGGVSPVLISWAIISNCEEQVCDSTIIAVSTPFTGDGEYADPNTTIFIGIVEIPGATGYILDFGTDSLPPATEEEVFEDSGFAFYIIAGGTLLPCETYYWRINPVFQGVNGDSVVLSCQIYSFTTMGCLPKSIKIDNNPEDVKGLNINSNIKVYPNPTNGELQIETGGLQIESIEILDALGRIQKVEALKNGAINISNLPAGNYFIRIKTEEGTITEQIIRK